MYEDYFKILNSDDKLSHIEFIKPNLNEHLEYRFQTVDELDVPKLPRLLLDPYTQEFTAEMTLIREMMAKGAAEVLTAHDITCC
jgi:hypothetical protein